MLRSLPVRSSRSSRPRPPTGSTNCSSCSGGAWRSAASRPTLDAPITIAPSDIEASWTLLPPGEQRLRRSHRRRPRVGRPLTGPASDIYLAMWNRLPLDRVDDRGRPRRCGGVPRIAPGAVTRPGGQSAPRARRTSGSASRSGRRATPRCASRNVDSVISENTHRVVTAGSKLPSSTIVRRRRGRRTHARACLADRPTSNATRRAARRRTGWRPRARRATTRRVHAAGRSTRLRPPGRRAPSRSATHPEAWSPCRWRRTA